MKKPKPKPTKPSSKFLVQEILDKGDKQEVRALFAFTENEAEVLLKFQPWADFSFLTTSKLLMRLFTKRWTRTTTVSIPEP